MLQVNMTKETRSHNGYIPTKEQVRAYRGKLTQDEAGALIYAGARRWRKYELGEEDMPAVCWDLLQYKLKELKNATV